MEELLCRIIIKLTIGAYIFLILRKWDGFSILFVIYSIDNEPWRLFYSVYMAAEKVG